MSMSSSGFRNRPARLPHSDSRPARFAVTLTHAPAGGDPLTGDPAPPGPGPVPPSPGAPPFGTPPAPAPGPHTTFTCGGGAAVQAARLRTDPTSTPKDALCFTRAFYST